MSKTATEETYLVPEIDLVITRAWINLIAYCQENLPYGDLFVKINNSQPGKKEKEIPNIRFDKSIPSPKEENQKWSTYLIQSLDMRIPQPWINLIQWCQDFFTSGKLGFRIVNACPTELLYSKPADVDFSKAETIPSGIPLEIDRLS